MAQKIFDADADAASSQYALGRIHSIESMGTVDGPGIRFVVFTQGCPMRCAYCHNPDTWAVNAGSMVSVEKLVQEFESNRQFYKSGGITVTGGEPLLQPDFLADLFRTMHENPRGRVHTCLDSCGYAGGEPLLQPDFLADLFRTMHENPRGRVHTCLDSCGYAYSPEHPERFDAVLRETDMVLLDIKHADPEGHRELTGCHTCLDSCGYAYSPEHPERFDAVLRETDMVLLDIKHADPEGHRELTGCDPARIIAFGDEIARRGIKTVIRHVIVPGITDTVEECEALGRLIAPWRNVVGLELLPYHIARRGIKTVIRHVIVPGITDTVEECEALGRLIAPWRNVVGLELLPYHTMGIVKYEKLGIPYKLEGVPQMDKARIPELRAAVLHGMRAGRAAEKNAYGA